MLSTASSSPDRNFRSAASWSGTIRYTSSLRYGSRLFALSTPNQYGLRPSTVFSPGTYCTTRHGPLVTIFSGGVLTLYADANVPLLYALSSTCFGMIFSSPAVMSIVAYGSGVLMTTVWESGAENSNG